MEGAVEARDGGGGGVRGDRGGGLTAEVCRGADEEELCRNEFLELNNCRSEVKTVLALHEAAAEGGAAAVAGPPVVNRDLRSDLLSCAPYDRLDGTLIRAGIPSFMVPGFNRLKDEFELENPELEVVIREIPTKMLTEDLTSLVPDLEVGLEDLIVYLSQGIPDLAEAGTLMDLTGRARSDTSLEFDDMLGFFKKRGAYYDGKVVALPLDGDFHILHYRRDVLEAFDAKPPKTWEEYITLAQELDGVDMNGDGEPDFGSCMRGAFCQPQFWYRTIAAPLLQTKGTSQGAFLDPEDLRLLFNSAAGEEAWRLFSAALDAGPTFEEAFANVPNKKRCQNIEGLDINPLGDTPLFGAGRCALLVTWGTVDAARLSVVDMDGAANVTGLVGSAPPPCSEQVLDRETNQLVQCSIRPKLCHNGSVNCAAFNAAGGWTGSVNRLSRVRDRAYSFLAFAASPKGSRILGGPPRGVNTPVRHSMLRGEGTVTQWERAGFDSRDVKELLNTLNVIFEDSNVVQELRLPQISQLLQYMDNALRKLAGERLGEPSDGQISSGEDVRAVLRDLERDWLLKINDIGLKKFQTIYRKSLSLPALPSPVPPGSTTAAGTVAAAVVPVVVAALLVLGLGLWLYQRRWARRVGRLRPRGPPAADPRTGLTPDCTAFVFTDVEQSTSLWESECGAGGERSAMAAAMRTHNSALTAVLNRCHGHLSSTEGDALICAFHNPTDALAFCLLGQRALIESNWPTALLDQPAAAPVPLDSADPPPTFTTNALAPSTATDDSGIDSASSWGQLSTRLGIARRSGAFLSSCIIAAIDGAVASIVGVCNSILGSVALGSMAPSQETRCEDSRNVPAGGAGAGRAGAHDLWLFRGLRVRMGVHTGPAAVRRNKASSHRVEYSGAVHATARAVGDAGHGGDVVVTGTALAGVDLGELSKLLGGEPPALFHAGNYRLGNLLGTTTFSEAGGLKCRPPRWNWATSRPGGVWLPDDDGMEGLVLAYPLDLAARGPVSYLQGPLRGVAQTGPHCFDAPTADSVTLAFAKVAGTSRLLSRDRVSDPSLDNRLKHLSEPVGNVERHGRVWYNLLEMASRCISKTVTDHGGYEVERSEGLCYAAFTCPAAALRWACVAHEALMRCPWPEGVTDLPGCEELEVPGEGGGGPVRVFRGPRIRVGVCEGRTAMAVHAATGRATYPGRLANRAARVAALANPGQTLANVSAVVAAGGPAGEDREGSWSAREVGYAQLKGVPDAVLLFAVHTPLLKRRPLPRLRLPRPATMKEQLSSSAPEMPIYNRGLKAPK